MCELCSSDQDEVSHHREGIKLEADLMMHFAEKLKMLADGKMNPHGEGAKLMGIKARLIVRYLAADWI